MIVCMPTHMHRHAHICPWPHTCMSIYMYDNIYAHWHACPHTLIHMHHIHAHVCPHTHTCPHPWTTYVSMYAKHILPCFWCAEDMSLFWYHSRSSLMGFFQGDRRTILTHFLLCLPACVRSSLKFIKTLSWAHCPPPHCAFPIVSSFRPSSSQIKTHL